MTTTNSTGLVNKTKHSPVLAALCEGLGRNRVSYAGPAKDAKDAERQWMAADWLTRKCAPAWLELRNQAAHASPAKDAERAWMCADWLTRKCAPAWLELAHAHDAARRLRGLPPIRSAAQMRQTIAALETARNDAEAILGDMAAIAEAGREVDRMRAAEGLPDMSGIAYAAAGAAWDSARAACDDAWETAEVVLAASRMRSAKARDAIEDAAYRAGTAAAEAAWTVIHDEIRDAAVEVARIAAWTVIHDEIRDADVEVARIPTDGDAEKAARDAAHATAAAAAWTVFDTVQRSAWELVDRMVKLA